MNVEALRKRLAEMNAGPGKRTIWKPKDEHHVRCMDVPGDESFGREVGYHYGVDGGKKMYCPASHGDECPFCDLAESLRSYRDADGNEKPEAVRKQDFEWFKKIQRAVKHYVPVIVRKDGADEIEGPLWWEMSPRTFQKLIEICCNDDWNEDHPDGGGSKVLTSLTTGLDLVVSLKKAGQKGNKTSYDLTDVEERKKFSALTKSGNAKAIVDRIPDFDSVAKRVDTNEAKKIFAEFESNLASGKIEADNGSGVEYPSNSAEKLDGDTPIDDVIAKLQAEVAKRS